MRITAQGSAANRKKPHNDLNLTSFIDILSMLIFFLIFNMAVNEVSAIQTNMGSDKAAAAPIKEPIKEVQAELKIALNKDSLELWDRGRPTKLPIAGAQADFNWEPVAQFLKTARTNFPQKKDMIVQSQDGVPYAMVIKAMDYSMSEGFKELIVMGVE